MTPERYRHVGEIFRAALEIDAERRAAYLDEACAGDGDLRGEVESLLAFQDTESDMFERPAFEAVATAIAADSKRGVVPGARLGKYRVLSHLGSGGMGDVYLAEDPSLGRRVALKVLPETFVHDTNRLKRFETEARAAAALNHPNIATLHTVEEVDGRHFITMEYVEGRSLAELIPEGGLPLTTFFDWFVPLADAMTHTHERGIVHRDVKPGNILVTPEGVPKVLDCGLARIERSNEMNQAIASGELTAEGVVLGTPAYMSPEQARAERVDHRSDIFSFGVLMYESLTGQRPFEGNSFAAIASQLLLAEPPPIAERRSDTPFLLSRLAHQTLEKDRRRRPQSMREVRAVLDAARAEYAGGAAVVAAPVEPRWRLTPRFVAGLAIVALLAALGAAWLVARSPRPEPLRVARFTVAPPPGQAATLSETRLSPDGRLLVFASRREGASQLVLRPLDTFEMQPIAGTEGARDPFFSPDGRWIAFFAGDRVLKKVPVEGGSALTICEECEAADADWGEGDAIVAAARDGLYRVSATGGRPERLTTVDVPAGERVHRAPQVLPGGRHALFTIDGAKGSRAAVVALGDGARSDVEGVGEAAVARYVATGHLVLARGKQLVAVPFDAQGLRAAGTETTVLEGIFSPPAFRVSSNGTLVYLPDVEARDGALVWVDREGAASPVFEQRAAFRSPHLSPDGSRLAVQVGRDVWVYEVATGRGVRLTFEGENQSPVWTPDGRRVVFASNAGGFWTIYAKAADGSGDAERLTSAEVRQLPYSWHPDGASLAVSSLVGQSNTDVVLFGPGGGAPFVAGPYIEDTPRFSPDGRWLAYFSMEAGRSEVHVVPYGRDGERVPVSRGGGMYPVWSRDGRELFYRKGRTVYGVLVGGAGRLEAGPPRALFEGPYLTGYDVAPDGRFLMVQSDGASRPEQLHVVLNWTAELARLTGSSQG